MPRVEHISTIYSIFTKNKQVSDALPLASTLIEGASIATLQLNWRSSDAEQRASYVGIRNDEHRIIKTRLQSADKEEGAFKLSL